MKALDLDHPGQFGENLFITANTEIKSASGKFLYNTLKVSNFHMTDPKDHNIYRAFAVLGGRDLLIEQPSVPFFAHDKPKKIYKREGDRCARTELATTKMLTAITKRGEGVKVAPRLIRRVLVVLPEDMIVTNDYDSKEPAVPVADFEVIYTYRAWISKEKEPRRIICWLFRIKSNDNELEHDSDSSDEDTLARRMKGRVVVL